MSKSAEARLIHYDLAGLYSVKAASSGSLGAGAAEHIKSVDTPEFLSTDAEPSSPLLFHGW
jgi:hypothetical protein